MKYLLSVLVLTLVFSAQTIAAEESAENGTSEKAPTEKTKKTERNPNAFNNVTNITSLGSQNNIIMFRMIDAANNAVCYVANGATTAIQCLPR